MLSHTPDGMTTEDPSVSLSVETGLEITQWLTSLHLPQYVSSFSRAGYHFCKDLRGLTEERLLELDQIPTGHRRRILSSLETLMVEVAGSEGLVKVPVRRKPMPRPRQSIPKENQRGTSYSSKIRSQQAGQDSEWMSIVDSSDAFSRRRCDGAFSDSGSASGDGSNESLETFPEDPCLYESADFAFERSSRGFQGEMVENEIYEQCPILQVPSEQRSTRSFKLRHRPVPDIPEHIFIPSYDWNTPAKNSTKPATKSEELTFTASPQKASVEQDSSIDPYGELFLFNSADNKLDVGKHVKFAASTKENVKHHVFSDKQSKEKLNKNNQDLSKQHYIDNNDDHGDYSTLQMSTNISQEKSNKNPSKHPSLHSVVHPPKDPHDLYSLASEGLSKPPHRDVSISPYACFYGAQKSKGKTGWLDKLSPQGNCVFQRRWVKLEGGNLTYYNSDKVTLLLTLTKRGDMFMLCV